MLVVVLVVIALLSLAGLTFSEMMVCEREGADLAVRQAQSRALAESGIAAARSLMAMDQQTQIEAGGWYDNPTQFQGVLMTDGQYPRDRGRFAVVAPYLEAGVVAGVRYGLEDESGRININTLVQLDKQSPGKGREVLMGLPGMTEDVADAILDWIDEDDEPREFGAEIDTYSSLVPGYAPKNGPLDTIEELLLVQGVTPTLLFGVDANRNGTADPTEPDPQSMEGIDNSDGSMTGGWAQYLTVSSREANVKADGQPKINLNQKDLNKLSQALQAIFTPEEVNFILFARQYGLYTGNNPATPSPPGSLKPDLNAQPKGQFKTLLDVIGAKVEIPAQSQSGAGGSGGSGSSKSAGSSKSGGSGSSSSGSSQQSTILASPFSPETDAMAEYLPKLLDNCSLSDAKTVPGRININQASRTVLLAIPGMTEDLVEKILADRQPDPLTADPTHQYETWLLTEGVVTLDEMKALMPYICAHGSLYRGQAIGYYDDGTASSRIEFVLDTGQKPPAIVFWRDISHLGRGYPLDVLGIDASGLESSSLSP